MDEYDIPKIIKQLLQTQKVRNYQKVKQDMLKGLAQEFTERANFEERLYFRWKKALDLFEAIFLLGREAGSEFNIGIRPYAAKHNDLVFEVLTRIHARSCLTTSAILSLLKTGHASDALARARTLHELRVIATFIKKGGNNLAERYLLYEAVESLKAIKQYEKYHEKLGLEPLESGTLEKLEQAVQQYHAKFMPHFHENVLRGDYGWAAIALNDKNPTFAKIEEEVGLAHWRPYFRMASQPVTRLVRYCLFIQIIMEKRNCLKPI